MRRIADYIAIRPYFIWLWGSITSNNAWQRSNSIYELLSLIIVVSVGESAALFSSQWNGKLSENRKRNQFRKPLAMRRRFRFAISLRDRKGTNEKCSTFSKCLEFRCVSAHSAGLAARSKHLIATKLNRADLQKCVFNICTVPVRGAINPTAPTDQTAVKPKSI